MPGHDPRRAAPGAGAAMPLKASRRGMVPPFIVMDVMRAANARDAAARSAAARSLAPSSTPTWSGAPV